MKRLLPLFAAVLAGCATPREGSETAPADLAVLSPALEKEALTGRVDFVRHVKPVLSMKCLPCHSGRTGPAQVLNLETRTGAFTPGTQGPRLVPGRPEQSRLFVNVSSTHAGVQAMPPVGNRITRSELNILHRWISQGAEWPAGPAGTLRADD